MPQSHETSRPERPSNWNELLGPFIRYDDLPESARDDDGLIVLVTRSGLKVSPSGQFDSSTVDENGNVVVDPWVGMLWRIAKEFEVSQLGYSEWTIAGSLLSPLDGSDASYAEQLFACTDDSERQRVVMDYVKRSQYGAAWAGIDLVLPSQQLGE